MPQEPQVDAKFTVLRYFKNDCGDRVWEFEEEYITEADYKRMEEWVDDHELYIKAIEAHPDFHGWVDQCEGCRASVRNCQQEEDCPLTMMGDETLDNWVQDCFGKEYDWCFLEYTRDEEVYELLEDFIVHDGEGNYKKGIAIIKRDEDEEAWANR